MTVPVMWGHIFVYAHVRTLCMGWMGSVVEESLKLRDAGELPASC